MFYFVLYILPLSLWSFRVSARHGRRGSKWIKETRNQGHVKTSLVGGNKSLEGPLPQREKRRPAREFPTKRPVLVRRPFQSVRTQPQQRTGPVKRIASVVKSLPVKRTTSGVQTAVPKIAVPKPAPKKDSLKPVTKKESPMKTDDNDQNNEKEVKKGERKEEYKEKPEEVKEYELDAKHLHALNLELQHIMIKVWQEFPDEPTSAEEKLVTDKFRNEAGDALRNVLGLNVTKRILNINSGLYVKLHFKISPDRSQLSFFTRKHNMRTFKCIDPSANVYAAEIGSFDDYDRICRLKEVSCGQAKATVRPCYSFSSCPPNLKTIFRGTQDNKIKGAEENNVVENEKITTTNEIAEIDKDGDATKINKCDVQPIKKEPKVEVTKEKTSPEPPKAVKSAEVTIKQEPVPEKVNIADANKTKPYASDKSKKLETKSEHMKDKTKKQKSNVTQIAKAAKKKNVNKKAILKKVNHDKLKIISEYDSLETEEIPEKDFAEEDEMDDKDILALISEGIVLDECGSEEE